MSNEPASGTPSTAIAIVGSKGRITLPAAVREALAVEAGDGVQFVAIEGGAFAVVAAHRTVTGSREGDGKPLRIGAVETQIRATAAHVAPADGGPDAAPALRAREDDPVDVDQLLRTFDPDRHGGEAMAASPVGVEAFSSAEPVDHGVRASGARMRDRARRLVLAGTDWLSADDMVPGHTADARSSSNVLHWLETSAMFALEINGRLRVPRYGLDQHLRPKAVIAEVLAVFRGMTAWRVAAWFESTNTHLDGARPRDLLDDKPEAVLAAAQAHLEAVMHG